MNVAELKPSAEYVPVSKQCDECGKYVEKIKRVYKGHKYCSTCYVRVFKPAECPKCGSQAKLPKNVPDAICSNCEKDKPCARCGKEPKYAIGKMTPYGPVCNACSVYFREAEPCEACGTHSPRLSRVLRQGHGLRLCPKCAQLDHATCNVCRRYKLLSEAADGRMLCKACLEQGEVSCTCCGKPMPAGYGKVCEHCYWTGTAQKRIQMDQAIFTKEMAEAFGEFGSWLIGIVGPRKAALNIHHYLDLFVEIERQWQCVPAYVELLAHFSAEGLRRVRLPMRWLCEAKGVEPDAEARERESEFRRIVTIVESVPGKSKARSVLASYGSMLRGREQAGKTTLRSIRLAMRPAASLLLACDPIGAKLPDQAALDRYLLGVPGQKAAVQGFLSFLRKEHQIELTPTTNEKRTRANRRKKLEREIMDMITRGDEVQDEQVRWIVLAMAYFHDRKISKKQVQQSNVDVVADGAGLRLEIGEERFWLPRIIGNDLRK